MPGAFADHNSVLSKMLTSHELLGFMSPSLANDILNWTYETERATYKATLQAAADARKVRAVFLERQPRSQRHATMIAALNRPNLEMVAGTLLRTWLVKKYKDMPALMHTQSQNFFLTYPQLVSKAMQNFLRVDGTTKVEKEKSTLKSFIAARSWTGLFGDAFRLARAWR